MELMLTVVANLVTISFIMGLLKGVTVVVFVVWFRIWGSMGQIVVPFVTNRMVDVLGERDVVEAVREECWGGGSCGVWGVVVGWYLGVNGLIGCWVGDWGNEF